MLICLFIYEGKNIFMANDIRLTKVEAKLIMVNWPESQLNPV